MREFSKVLGSSHDGVSVARPQGIAPPTGAEPATARSSGSDLKVPKFPGSIGNRNGNLRCGPADEELERATELVIRELGATVVEERSGSRAWSRPTSAELFAIASDHDYPRIDLPDGTTILAGKTCWAAFCKAAYPNDRRDAIAALRELGAEA